MRRITPVVLAAVALGGCVARSSGGFGESASSDQGQDLVPGKPYLSLGDSVAFGYNPVDAANDPTNESAFVGYPELMTSACGWGPTPVGNASCEGETSGSFLSTSTPDNGCAAWRAAGNAMHVTYASAAESQLEFGLAYLAAHPDTATVSIGIGADDLLLVQYACEAQFDPVTDSNYASDVAQCELANAPAAIESVAQNLGTIAGAIRESGYARQLVLVTYYALQYSDASDPTLQVTLALDEAMVQLAQSQAQLHLSIARGFSAFADVANDRAGGDSCKAGLLYVLPDGTCDKHPSAAGQALLARAIAAAVPAQRIDLSESPPRM